VKDKHSLFHKFIMVLVALVFIGIIWGIVRGKGSTAIQEEFTMQDGQKVTCFTSIIGRFPTMQCIPHKDSSRKGATDGR
jgi:hypothetical protein